MPDWGDVPGGFKAFRQGMAPLSGVGGMTAQLSGENA
jgi:hypothetical protein